MTRRVGWLVFGFLCVVYIITTRGVSDLGDAETYFVITQSIVEHGRVDLPPEAGITEQVFNPRGIIVSPDGRKYSQYWLGYPIFQVPWYLAGKLVGNVVGSFAPRLDAFSRFWPRLAVNLAGGFVTAATGAVLFVLLVTLGISRSYSAATALIYGLATYAWPYSKIGFFEPFMGLALIFCLLMLVWFDRRQASLGYVLGFAFALGWGTATKPSLVLAWPPLLIYLLVVMRRGTGGRSPRWQKQWLTAGAVIVGLAPWVIVCLWYNWVRTGSYLDPGYPAGNFAPCLALGHYVPGLVAHLVGPARGFFIYSPAVILLFWGLAGAWRDYRPLTMVVVAISLLFWGAFAARRLWGFWCWGPRYLLPITPLVMILVAEGLRRLWASRRGKKAVVALLAVSLAVQLLAIIVPYGTWLRKVEAATGGARGVILSPRYCPLGGQIDSLRNVSFDAINFQATNLQSGRPTDEFKTALRHSLDFWWVYAYRLGVPTGLIAVPLGLLMAGGIYLGLKLRAAIRSGAATDGEAMG